MRFTTFILMFILPLVAWVDHHETPSPAVMELWDCELNSGYTINDMAAFARDEVAPFADKGELQQRSFIWEPLAIAPPYHETDFRWVNYTPSWEAWNQTREHFSGKEADKLLEKFSKIADCGNAVFASVRGVAPIPESSEKPLVLGVCKLNSGKTMGDVMKYRTSGRVNAINESLGIQSGQVLIMPGFGMAGDFDFLTMIAGTTPDMLKLMDGVRTGEVGKAHQAHSEMENPADCYWDLHKSHTIRN